MMELTAILASIVREPSITRHTRGALNRNIHGKIMPSLLYIENIDIPRLTSVLSAQSCRHKEPPLRPAPTQVKFSLQSSVDKQPWEKQKHGSSGSAGVPSTPHYWHEHKSISKTITYIGYPRNEEMRRTWYPAFIRDIMGMLRQFKPRLIKIHDDEYLHKRNPFYKFLALHKWSRNMT